MAKGERLRADDFDRLMREMDEVHDLGWYGPPKDMPLPPAPPINHRPRLVGAGPCEFATTTDVERFPVFVWDVNRYYADLGVPVRATKREIRERYQAIDGHESPRLTFIVKQLLDDGVRARYDAVPYGSVFFDAEIERAVKKRIIEEAAAARAAGEDDDAFEEIDLSDSRGKAFSMLDPDAGNGQDALRRWGWSYYLWRSENPEQWRLREWQELLVAALARRRKNTRLAVGFVGGTAPPFGVYTVGYRLVVFLHEDESPTEALAHAAASRVVDHLNGATAPQAEG